jgi:hypothetical protein
MSSKQFRLQQIGMELVTRGVSVADASKVMAQFRRKPFADVEAEAKRLARERTQNAYARAVAGIDPKATDRLCRALEALQ